MKVAYVSNSSATTKKAHGLQIAKMCEALTDQGAAVELILPDRSRRIKRGDFFDFFGVRRSFRLVKLPVWDAVHWGRLGFLLTAFSFRRRLAKYLRSRPAEGIIYGRDLAVLFGSVPQPVFFEAHRLPGNFLTKRVLRRAKGIVAITRGLADALVRSGIKPENILVAPDGVDLTEFDLSITQTEARQKLNLPLDKRIILYAGNLNFAWKGVTTVEQAAASFGPETLFVLVGVGATGRFRQPNILAVAHRPHREIPFWLKAADALLLPNSAKAEISRRYTSPLKMFEYLAAGRPLVASDLPSVREVLNEGNAWLIQPDDPAALAAAIKAVLNDPTLADKRCQQGLADVQDYSWQKRAQRILKFINQKVNG